MTDRLADRQAGGHTWTVSLTGGRRGIVGEIDSSRYLELDPFFFFFFR